MSNTRELHPEQTPTAEGGRLYTDVLCAVDGTRKSFAAVEQGAVLAGAEGRLTLLAVTAVAGAGAYRTAAISPLRAERLLERASGLAGRLGVVCETIVDADGPPPQVILERAAEHDLLALGAPAASWFASRLADGVVAAALKTLEQPVLAARQLAHGEHRFAERLLVASDGTEDSDEVVEVARRLAEEHDSSVVLVHVAADESRVPPERVHEQSQRLGGLIKDSRDLRIELGGAAEAIAAAAAETESTLIVMGSRRLGGLRAIGSVSRRVVREAGCSVLLAPPASL